MHISCPSLQQIQNLSPTVLPLPMPTEEEQSIHRQIAKVVADQALFEKALRTTQIPQLSDIQQTIRLYIPNTSLEEDSSPNNISIILHEALHACQRKKSRLVGQVEIQTTLPHSWPQTKFCQGEHLANQEIVLKVLDHLELPDLAECAQVSSTWKELALHSLFKQQKRHTLEALRFLYNEIDKRMSLRPYACILLDIQELYDSILRISHVQSFAKMHHFQVYVQEQIISIMQTFPSEDLKILDKLFEVTRKPHSLLESLKMAISYQDFEMAKRIQDPIEQCLKMKTTLLSLADLNTFHDTHKLVLLAQQIREPAIFAYTVHDIFEKMILKGHCIACIQIARKLGQTHIAIKLPYPLDPGLTNDPNQIVQERSGRYKKNAYTNPFEKDIDLFNISIGQCLLGQDEKAFQTADQTNQLSLHRLLMRALFTQGKEKKALKLILRVKSGDIKKCLLDDLPMIHVSYGHLEKALYYLQTFPARPAVHSMILDQIATRCRHQGDLLQAHQIAKTITHPLHKSNQLVAISKAYQAQGQLQDSLQIALAVTHPDEKKTLCLELFNQFLHIKQYDRALLAINGIPIDCTHETSECRQQLVEKLLKEEQFQTAIQIAEDISDKVIQTHVWKTLFDTFFRMEVFETAQKIAQKIKQEPLRSQSLGQLVLKYEGNIKKCQQLLPFIRPENLPDDLREEIQKIANIVHQVERVLNK